MLSEKEKPELIELPKITDLRGSLTSLQGGVDLPFEIRRVYYIYDVPPEMTRGGHAHKYGRDIVIALSGSVEMTLDDGVKSTTYTLSAPDRGLLRPPGFWITLDHFAPGTVLLVLADTIYDENAYIRDREEFLKRH